MANRTPPFKNYPEWSSAKFWSFIRSALRQASSRYPVRYNVLKAGRRNYHGKDRRIKFEHQCARCKEWVPQKLIEVDHIVPAGRLSDFQDLPGFVERLFCGPDGLRKLCKPCHKIVTEEQKNA